MVAGKIWKTLLSDLFVNLSAGWFGAVFIIPAFTRNSLAIDLPVLTADLVLGILCLVFSYQLKK